MYHYKYAAFVCSLALEEFVPLLLKNSMSFKWLMRAIIYFCLTFISTMKATLSLKKNLFCKCVPAKTDSST